MTYTIYSKQRQKNSTIRKKKDYYKKLEKFQAFVQV